MDTCIFIAAEQDRTMADPPDGDGRVSVETLTEPGVGVRRARDPNLREDRQATLDRARKFIPLVYDDAIIAATALAHDLTVWDPGR